MSIRTLLKKLILTMWITKSIMLGLLAIVKLWDREKQIPTTKKRRVRKGAKYQVPSPAIVVDEALTNGRIRDGE